MVIKEMAEVLPDLVGEGLQTLAKPCRGLKTPTYDVAFAKVFR